MLLLFVVFGSFALSSAQKFNCYYLNATRSLTQPADCNSVGELSAENLFNAQSYDADAMYNITLTILNDEVPSFVIVQARLSNGYYTTAGSFISNGNGQESVLACRSKDDTFISNNSVVTFTWKAPDSKVEGIRFHYTVVTNASYCSDTVTKVIYPRAPVYLKLVRAHGGLMIVAWCVLAPCAILLAFFYKTVCIHGEWFYIHIVIQILTLLLNIAGIVVIFVYGNFNGGWTTTTNLNWPHQVIGLFTILLLLINPFLAICRCHQDHPLRWIFNYIHGGIGLVALLCSMTTMLLGLHIYKTLVGYTDYSHYAIYSLSGTVAVILITLAIYNIYTLNFNIRANAKAYTDADAPTSDWLCRVVAAIIVVALLLTGTAATLVMIALT